MIEFCNPIISAVRNSQISYVTVHGNIPCVDYSSVCVPAQALQQGYVNYILTISHSVESKCWFLDATALWSDLDRRQQSVRCWVEGTEIRSRTLNSRFSDSLASTSWIGSSQLRKALQQLWIVKKKSRASTRRLSSDGSCAIDLCRFFYTNLCSTVRISVPTCNYLNLNWSESNEINNNLIVSGSRLNDDCSEKSRRRRHQYAGRLALARIA